MTDAWITGSAVTVFVRDEHATEADLATRAADAALADAGVGAEAIDAVFVANVLGGPGAGQKALCDSPLTGLPIVNVENACASSSSALLEGVAWIEAGFAHRVLVIGVEVMTERVGSLLPLDEADPYARQGLTLPALYAMKARDHMERFGTTPEQFAAVSVKNRAHGSLNPHARFQQPVTLDEVLASPAIADPITLLQCCASADGAAAVVVAHRSAAGDRAVRVAGCALASGRRRADVGWNETVLGETAALALRRAGHRPEDVDLAEVHDAFAPAELLAYERLGFSEPGKGGADLEGGRFSLGGAGPVVNPSGGLLARGHPLGATGLAQINEVVTQLRGEAGPRQVDGASVGLAAAMGGGVLQIETNACVVTVLSREVLPT
jgi:acetyl-CoA acetyltransferase